MTTHASPDTSDGSPATALLVALMIICLLELWLGSVERGDQLANELERLKHVKTTNHFLGTAD